MAENSLDYGKLQQMKELNSVEKELQREEEAVEEKSVSEILTELNELKREFAGEVGEKLPEFLDSKVEREIFDKFQNAD